MGDKQSMVDSFVIINIEALLPIWKSLIVQIDHAEENYIGVFLEFILFYKGGASLINNKFHFFQTLTVLGFCENLKFAFKNR